MEASFAGKSPAFEYQSFKNPSSEIRLVILEPAESDSAQIRCRLDIVDIRNTSYEALSYVWGDQFSHPTILVNGHAFKVTINLYYALQNLRIISSNSSLIRILWVDAICINQDDNHERSEQVEKMASIYRSAKQVVIWLGRYHEPEDMK